VVDNRYRGHPLALWLLWPAIIAALWRSQHHMLAPDGGAQSIATMPLDLYPPGARANIIALFGQWGLSQLLLALLMLLVALRWRALVPLMWLLIVLEAGGRQLVGWAKPVVTLHTAPGAAGNLPLLLVALVMLALSLRPSRSPDGRAD
jgi:hypothetical protein